MIYPIKTGLALYGHREISTRLPITQAPIPDELILPLAQHNGTASLPVVKAGNHVKKGQLIAKAQGFISANLHAPVNAMVKTIELRPVPHPSGLDGECIILKPGRDSSWPTPITQPADCINISQYEPQHIYQKVRDAGIVGMGGATFPTSAKIKSGIEQTIDTLIINGCECEPWITCDEMLLLERAQHVISGCRLIQQAIKAEKRVLAIEEKATETIDLLYDAIASFDDSIQLAVLPNRYPTGSEKQLIQIMTNQQVPFDGLPADIGLAVYNTATTAAIFQAVVHDEPLISRLVTISGMGIKQPRVLEVLLGTPVSALLEFCGGLTSDANGLVMGGTMMGLGLTSEAVPVTKGMNAVLVTTPDMMQDPQGEMPCIRCGECARVCPAQLVPQQLLSLIRAANLEQAQHWNLEACIECGCCNAVCPSHIPLVDYYRHAKSEIRAQGIARARAQHSRQRYEFRNQRLEKARQEREAYLKRKKASLKAKTTAIDAPNNPEAIK